MIFEVYPAGIFQANCYILGDTESNEAAIVDPGGDAKGIMEIVNNRNLNIKYIMLTHGHGDHIGAVHDIKKMTSCSILMHKKDEYLVKGETRILIPILRNIELFDVDSFIRENDIIKIGDIEIKVIETPGHTPGGISFAVKNVYKKDDSFIVENMILSGDSLFRESIGRTDFPNCSYEDLISSIKNKIMVYEDNIKVYPGHGMPTTVGHERKYNPFLK